MPLRVLNNEDYIHEIISSSITLKRRHVPGSCNQSLGMESGDIPDSAITASSSYVTNVGPRNGRWAHYFYDPPLSVTLKDTPRFFNVLRGGWGPIVFIRAASLTHRHRPRRVSFFVPPRAWTPIFYAAVARVFITQRSHSIYPSRKFAFSKQAISI